MSKSLAERRTAAASSPPRLPTQAIPDICLRHDLVAQVEEKERQLALARVDFEARAKVRKMAEGAQSPEVDALEAEVDALYREMEDDTGTLTVAMKWTLGEWSRWCAEHPAAAEGEPGYDRDMRVALGYCSADALLDALPEFAHTWDGEELSDGDFAIAGPGVAAPIAIAPKDALGVATAVVVMYEVTQAGKVVRGLSATRDDSNGSNSPETSE